MQDIMSADVRKIYTDAAYKLLIPLKFSLITFEMMLKSQQTLLLSLNIKQFVANMQPYIAKSEFKHYKSVIFIENSLKCFV